LAAQKEHFDEFSFTANRHSRETFEPFALGAFRFGVEPPGRQLKPGSRILALLDAVEQVTEERGREMVTPDSRHGTAPQILSNAAIRRPEGVKKSSVMLSEAKNLHSSL
jgi:hypothetical protein